MSACHEDGTSIGSFVHAMGPARCRVGEGLLAERSIEVKEARGTKTNQVNARMATADHDRQEQAAHKQYKSRIVLIQVSPCIIDTHKREKFSS